jgi:hypothetical protein
MSKTWSDIDSKAACIQGWDLFDVNGIWRIKRRADLVPNDEYARGYVDGLAIGDSNSTAIKALQLEGKPVSTMLDEIPYNEGCLFWHYDR